jgi:hypothetical protein
MTRYYSFDDFLMLYLGGAPQRKKEEQSNIPEASGMFIDKLQTELYAIKLRENFNVRRQLIFVAAIFDSHGPLSTEIQTYYLMRFNFP